MDEWLCSRGEMRDFTKRALALGVNYIGICCGSMSHSLRVMAEELKKPHAAAKYAPNMHLNMIFGDDDRLKFKLRQEFPMIVKTAEPNLTVCKNDA